MGIWIFMLLCTLLTPALMVLFGGIAIKHPPKSINMIYGYRTSMSTKNQDTWDFAQAYCGKLWWKLGWIMFGSVLIVMLGILLSGNNEHILYNAITIIMIIEVIVLILSIIPVEKALHKTFNKDGSRK